MSKIVNEIRNEPSYGSRKRGRPLKPEYLDMAIGYFKGQISASQMRRYLNKKSEFVNLDTQITSLMYLINRSFKNGVEKGDIEIIDHRKHETQP